MYRILAEDQPVRERRDQLTHPAYTKPELVATAPNQRWSWDITRLLGPKKWTYYCLYVLIGIFQPVRRRVDGRRPRELRAGQPAHPGDLPQAGTSSR